MRRKLPSSLGEDGTRRHYFPLKPTRLHGAIAQKATSTYVFIDYVSGSETQVFGIIKD
jgi:hypothetical protein